MASSPNHNLEIYFHVGLGKVASTYLQYKVFPKFTGIEYIQRTRHRQYASILKAKGEGRFLLSREYDRQLQWEIENFGKDFKDVRSIILLRRQDGWIASQYRRYVKNGGCLPFNRFYDVEHNKGLWDRRECDFYAKLKLLEQTYTYKPFVLFHDELKRDTKAFVQKIARYIHADIDLGHISDRPAHQSYNDKQLRIIRCFNKFVYGDNTPRGYANRLVNWLLFRPIWLLNHLVLYIAYFIPEAWVRDKVLIPNEELKKVDDHFADNWQKCLAYARANNP